MPEQEFDATPSWSGYTYQGKLAIFESVKIIRHLVEKEQTAELPHYSVELEWEEDFAIKKGAAYSSLHQVKAYKDSVPSKYKSSIQNLLHKISIHKDVIGYLHVWKDIRYTEEISTFENMVQIYDHKGYDQSVRDNIKLYKYAGGTSCDLDQIYKYISSEVDKYYKAINKTATAQQIDGAVIALCDLVDKHVMFRHKNQGSSKQPKEITFSEILATLNTNYEEPSAEYIFQKTKQFALHMVSDFCDNTLLCTRKACEEECGVKLASLEIEKMSPKELFWFLVHRSPDEIVDSNKITMEEYRAICDKDGIKNALYKAIYELPHARYIKGQYKTLNNALYLPTTLHQKENAPEIAKNILKNPSIKAILPLYNYDKFISKDVLIDDLVTMAGGVRSWDPNIIQAFVDDSGEKINKIKSIKVIPIEDAKREVQQ